MTLISTYKKGIYRIEDIIKERNVLINEKLNIITIHCTQLSERSSDTLDLSDIFCTFQIKVITLFSFF